MLAAFLAHHESKPQVWGEVDCCLVLADWMEWLGYEDCAADLRGTYDSEDGCRSVIAAAGGLRPLIERCNRLGLEETEVPTVGSIGLIGSATSINRQWGAIWNGERWLVRMERGFVPFFAKPLVIWKCP